jgi:glycosidase
MQRFPCFLALIFLPLSFANGQSGFSSSKSASVVPDSSGFRPASISVSNFHEYPLELKPYECRIYDISGCSATVDTDKGWWKDAVIYQVHPRSYYDSDGDGKGDLRGLAMKLDYITNIGFDAVWTCPIFASPLSDDGYDVSDYYTIHSDYGNLDDFRNYALQASNRGVRVILDMVINHTASNCGWFLRSQTNDPVYANWYVWTNASLRDLALSGWQKPWGGGIVSDVWRFSPIRGENYYGAFIFIGGAPDLNYCEKAVRTEVKKIGCYWLSNGASGYRLDAIRYLVEEGPGALQADTASTLAFLTDYVATLKSVNSDAFTVGEVWASTSVITRYAAGGKGLDSCFDFDLGGNLKNALARQSGSSLAGFLRKLRATGKISYFAPFLDNHDMSRYMNWPEVDSSFPVAKLLASILLTLPGTPCVYYGDEIGMRNAPGIPGADDRYQYRSPMLWDRSAAAGFTTGKPWNAVGANGDPWNVASQENDPDSLLSAYRELIALRHRENGLRRGGLTLVNPSSSSALAYVRPGSTNAVLVVANFSQTNIRFGLDFSGTGLSTNSNYSVIQVR